MTSRMRSGTVALVALCATTSAAAATLHVNEGATRVRLYEDRFGVRLVVQNATGVTLRADAAVEMLDPNDAVRAHAETHLTIEPGLRALDVAPRPGLSSLHPDERRGILQYRVRYRLELESPPPGLPGRLTGVLAVSRLTPDIFELRLLNSDAGQAGRPLHVVVQAVHPVTSRPVSGVAVEAKLVLDRENPRTLSSTRTTDGRGLAVFNLEVPLDIDNGYNAELKVLGRSAGLTAEASSDVQLFRLASVLVSTDKPLYQPGQALHVRALARGWEGGPALADLPLKVTVRDGDYDAVFEVSVRTSRFGVATADWAIPEHARLGSYVVDVEAEQEAGGFQGVGGAFLKVSRYELPQFAVKAVPDRSYYLAGEKPQVEVRADYLFGKPVTRGRVRVALESRREWDFKQQRYDVEERASQEGQLAESGRYTASFELGDEAFPEEGAWTPYRDIEGTAYVTDATTGRTEEGRFTLRATREPIHLYLIDRYAEPCDDREDRACRASFYVSATYADGTPASCEVGIARRIGAAGGSEAGQHPTPAEPLTTVHTNRFGLAKVTELKVGSVERRGEGEGEHDATGLILTARDAKGWVGRREVDLASRWSSRLLVDSGHAIHVPGQPVEVTLRSQSVRGAVLVDLVSANEVLASRLVFLSGATTRVAFPYQARFKGVLRVEATAVVDEEGYESESDTGFFGILYPTAPDLRVDSENDRAEYRPGEEAHIRLAVRSGDGRPAPGVLGVAVIDRALEERAASERGSSRASGFLGPFREEESLGGIALGDLLALDTRQPIAADLDLVTEVTLAHRGFFTRRRETSDAFDRDTGAAFRSRFETQLQPVADALRRRFDPEAGGPNDLESVTRTLAESAVTSDSMHDPWDRPYRITLGPHEGQMLVEIHSDGPDKTQGTADDLVALSRAWYYFAPRGRMIDRAAQQHYEETGAPIRDVETLRARLAALGEDIDTWRDPWSHPFRFRFTIAGPYALITSQSAGPDGVFGADPKQPGDDIVLSTVRTEYFARDKHKIQKTLDSLFAESGAFPQTEDDWSKILARAGLESSSPVDPWQRPYYVLFRSESAYANRVRIRSYADLMDDRRRRTEEAPVTRAIEVVSLWSRGPDGEVNRDDDFEVASLRRTVAERESAVGAASPGESVVLSKGEGAIAGTVTDSSGAVLPGAHVEAKDEVTGGRWTAVADAKGRYVLDGLARGFYLVSVTMPGFQSALVTRVPVEPGQKTQLDVSLAVGAMTETVEVGAHAPMVRTVSASLAAQVEEGAETRRARPPIATPRVRRDFPETLFWQPALETDTLGRVSVRLKLADTITTWKMGVVASTIGGQVAIAERELLAFQPFFVENDPPAILTAGDSIGLPALVRNYTDDPLRVTLDAEAGDGLQIAGTTRREVPVPAGDAGRTTFDLRAAQAAKKAKVVVKAASGKASDAVEKNVTIHPDGAETELATGLLIDQDAVLDLAIPEYAVPGSIHAELRIAPNLSAHVLESVEAVMRRPYGCAEQAISSAYPSLLALRLIGDGHSGKALESRARRYLDLGYQRLLDYQAVAGGFTYFHGGESDVALTAYAVRFLSDLAPFLDVDETALDHARSFLLSRQEPDGRWRAHAWYRMGEDDRRSLSLTALIARTLASLPEPKSKAMVSGKEQAAVRSALDRAISYLGKATEERDDPYGLASLALAAHAAHADAAEQRALGRLRTLAHDEAGGSYWAYEVNTPFFGWGRAARIETTALAVKALAQSGDDRDGPVVDKGLLFLLRNRDRYGIWWSGQATVNVLDAIVSIIGAAPETAETDTLEVFVNGHETRALTLGGDDEVTGALTVDLTSFVAPGANRIELRRTHQGARVSAEAVAMYYVPWMQAKLRTSDSLRFEARFDKTEAHRAEAIGVHVEAERVGFKGYGMLLAEIGLPPGVDVDRESLDRAVEASGYSFCLYEIQPDRVVAYLWPRAGGLAFDFVVRPRLSMRARSAASTLYDYYNPEAAVTLPPRTFVVQE